MNREQKFKRKKRIFFSIVKIILFILLSYLAIRIGIFGGTLLSSADSKIVRNVDVDNFKTTLSSSFPIIDTIYNSGNISVSFTGGIKSAIRKIFDFDLSNPITILNAESPHIHSYYMGDYQRILAQRDRVDNPVEIQENEPDKEDNGQDEDNTGLIEDQSSIYMEADKEENDTSENNTVSKGRIAIDNQIKAKIDIDELLRQPLNISFNKKGPKVLIYHTHTTESFINTLGDLNKSGISSRTRDQKYNVVRVGDELAGNLRKKYGIEVIHNGAIHDYPIYDTAYGKSLITASRILKSYPSIKVAFDIHRDGLGTGKKLRAVTKINGKNAAQVMFVVGTNASGLSHPNWMENLKFAVKLTEKLNEISPGLSRPVPILLSKNRYNQHLCSNMLIIEIGGDGNLVSECIESTKYVAQAINEVINKK